MAALDDSNRLTAKARTTTCPPPLTKRPLSKALAERMCSPHTTPPWLVRHAAAAPAPTPTATKPATARPTNPTPSPRTQATPLWQKARWAAFKDRSAWDHQLFDNVWNGYNTVKHFTAEELFMQPAQKQGGKRTPHPHIRTEWQNMTLPKAVIDAYRQKPSTTPPRRPAGPRACFSRPPCASTLQRPIGQTPASRPPNLSRTWARRLTTALLKTQDTVTRAECVQSARLTHT